MKMPLNEALDTAIAWLEANEGDNGEAERCREVARWLEHMNEAAFVRREARLRGITPAAFRKLLKKYDEHRKQIGDV